MTTLSDVLPFSLGGVLAKSIPGAKFIISGNSYEGLQWLSDTPKSTFEQILEWAQLYPNESSDKTSLLVELKPFVAKARLTTSHNDFALMLMCLSTVLSREILQSALAGVRAGMPEDSTTQEKTQINAIFKKHNVNIELV